MKRVGARDGEDHILQKRAHLLPETKCVTAEDFMVRVDMRLVLCYSIF